MRDSSSIIRILVVDGYEPFRRFVSATLRARPEWQVIGEASDGLQAVQHAETLQPDLILLDIGLPTLNGLKLHIESPDSSQAQQSSSSVRKVMRM